MYSFKTVMQQFTKAAMNVGSILRPTTDDHATSNHKNASLVACLGWMVVGSAFYGAILGSHGAVVGARHFSDQTLQMFYSALKVPLLFGVSTLCALPSFFVFCTLAGLRVDWNRSFRALITSQSATAIILCSFAPLTLFVHACVSDSSEGYQLTILFNGLLFAIATLASQAVLHREYRPLIERDVRHRFMLRVWWFLYALIGIQAGWTMRPFVGATTTATTFFRQESWSNAYVEIWKMIVHVCALWRPT